MIKSDDYVITIMFTISELIILSASIMCMPKLSRSFELQPILSILLSILSAKSTELELSALSIFAMTIFLHVYLCITFIAGVFFYYFIVSFN